MNKLLLSLITLLVLSGNSWAAILVKTANGALVASPGITTLEGARTSVGAASKTFVITSTLTQAQSNITGAFTGALKVEKGGSIVNSTAFTVTGSLEMSGGTFSGAGAIAINGPFKAGDYQCFTGTSVVTGKGVRSNKPDWWGAVGDGSTFDTTAVDKAIACAISGAGTGSGFGQMEAGGVVNFRSAAYKLAALAPITKPVTLNFNNSYIYGVTAGIVIEVNTGQTFFGERVNIKDVTFLFTNSATQPTDLIKITSGDSILLENVNTWEVITTHSFIWHYTGTGVTLRNCTFQGGTTPAAISTTHSLVDPLIYSNVINLDNIAIASITGQGVYGNGGDIIIQGKSFIQSCSAGGAQFDGPYNNITISDSYFETNTGFDIFFNNNDPAFPIHAAVRSTMFMGATPLTRIKVDAGVILTTQANLFTTGGIDGVAPPLSYIGVNNRQATATAGYSGAFDIEMADAIRTTATNATFHTKNGIFGPMRLGRSALTAGVNSVGGVGTVTRGAGENTVLTIGKYGALIMVDTSANGGSALFYATYDSATITKLADTAGIWAITDVGAGMAIYKSANSFDVNIKNRTALSNSLTVNVLGAVNSVALP